MRVIDEKGRFFGKINIIDFLVIVFLLCFIPIFYFGHEIFVQRETPKVEVPKKEFNFGFTELKPELLKLISVGDKENDKNGQVIGEILNLQNPEPMTYKIDIGSGQKLVVKKDPILKQMVVTLRIKAELRQNSLYYKDKQISNNSAIDFITDKYRVKAVFLQSLTPNDDDKRKEQEISDLNKISTLENKIATLENRIAAVELALETKGKHR